MATASAHPSSYDSGYSAYSVSNLPNGYTDSSSTTYAQLNLTRGSGGVTQIYYNFDFSSIPEGATIDSIECSVKGYVNTTVASRIAQRSVQLYSGSTAKGSASSLNNTVSTYTLSVGTWTRAELQSAKLRIYVVRGTSNTSTNYYIRFYGATITVGYTEPVTGDKIFIKSNGSWVEASKVYVKVNGAWSEVNKVYKKENGSWVEQSDKSALFDGTLVKS